MDSGTQTLDATAVLAAARRFRREANAAEAGVLAQAIEWCRLHQVEDSGMVATWHDSRGCDTGIPIAGDGAPQVSEFAVAEFAALGLSAMAGRNLVAQAWELAHRLPRTWARVQTGDLAPWRARRIADDTLTLSFDAAAWVDQMVAPFAHKTGPAQVQRLVETAITRFMPDYAAEQRDRAAEQRYFTIDTDQVSFAGTARVHGELDLADALDLEDAVHAGAQQLADLGSGDTLDVRRAAAVGMLARGDQPLHLEKAETPVPRTTSREIVLYVHLSEDAIRTGDQHAPTWLENAGGRLLTSGQVAEWCGRDDTTKVTVKPVRDLNEFHAVDQYKVPEWMAEQVRLRDVTCIFP
ncbi:MAG TPA: DUF222 domain-containing protein, partial [Marmoricola sp.]|nr:DUF222 domain-containing protein [Marmoricola sp.]